MFIDQDVTKIKNPPGCEQNLKTKHNTKFTKNTWGFGRNRLCHYLQKRTEVQLALFVAAMEELFKGTEQPESYRGDARYLVTKAKSKPPGISLVFVLRQSNIPTELSQIFIRGHLEDNVAHFNSAGMMRDHHPNKIYAMIA